MKIIAAVNLLQGMKQASNLHLEGGNDSGWLTTLHNLFLSMHIYEQFQQKIVFSGPHIPLICSRCKTVVLKGGIFHNLPDWKSERARERAEHLSTYQWLGQQEYGK